MKQLFDSFKSTSLDVLPNLKERYGLLLRHDLVSVKLMQKEGQILLEFTVTDKDHYSFDNKIIVKSLSLNSAADSVFSSTVSIFENGYCFFNSISLFHAETFRYDFCYFRNIGY